MLHAGPKVYKRNLLGEQAAPLLPLPWVEGPLGISCLDTHVYLPTNGAAQPQPVPLTAAGLHPIDAC